MCVKKRARSHEDKKDKTEKIIACANELWLSTDFASFTMQTLATNMQIAKGTLYLYFKTKEEVLLALYRRDLSVWFTEVQAALQKQKTWTVEKVANILVENLNKIDGLVHLIAILGTILEKNISLQEAVDFKRWLLLESQKTSLALEKALPLLHKGEAYSILVFFQANASGLYSMTIKSPVIHELLKETEFKALNIDFTKSLKMGMEIFMKGILSARAS